MVQIIFFSIDPPSLKKLISEIRLIERIKGDGKKIPQPSEVKNIVNIRKSITAAKNIQKGEVLSQQKLAIKRPANGLDPKFWTQIIGKEVNKDIKKDFPIKWEDIS